MIPRLTKTQRYELACVFPAHPDSVHEQDREAERWLRYITRRSTIESLQRLGLCGRWYRDYPVGGYRAELTEEGIRVRTELLQEEQP